MECKSRREGLDLEPDPDHSPPDGLEDRHHDAAGQDRPHRHQWLAIPVQDGIDEGIAHNRAGGSGWCRRHLLTSPLTHSCASRRPVDQGEGGVVDPEDDGQIEVVDADGSGRDHDIKYTGGSVDTVEEDIQYLHPGSFISYHYFGTTEHGRLTFYEMILHHVGMERDPVDDCDEEGDCGEAGLEAPGHRVQAREVVRRDGVRFDLLPDNDPGIEEVVEGQQTDA